MALEQQPIDVPPGYQHRPVPGESTMDRACPHLRRTNRIPFPTARRAISLPSTSNKEPDRLPDTDIPEEIRIHPDIPTNIDPERDQHSPRELLGLEHREEEDPFNADGPNFEWPELAPVDREILGFARAYAWDIQQRDIEERTTDHLPSPREPMDLYLAINRGEPLDAPGAAPFEERLVANTGRTIWDPAPG